MRPADHHWKRPPPGQSGLEVCDKCGQRKIPDLDNPDHPDHGCTGRPQDAVVVSNDSDYDPIA